MDKRDIPNELIKRLKRLTPEQWKRAKPWISDYFARRRRERFRFIRGGRQDPITAMTNALASELAGLKPGDPRRDEIITELSLCVC